MRILPHMAPAQTHADQHTDLFFFRQGRRGRQWLSHLDGRHFHLKMAGEYVLKRQNRKTIVSGV